MTVASEKWNALPKEVRDAAFGSMIERQIGDIHIEISRAKAAHKKHLADARSHLKNLEEELSRWERKNATTDRRV